MFNFFKKNKELHIVAPISGKAVDLSEVPDAVFAERMIGDGLAIIPEGNQILSPCDGKVIQIFPTNHAVGIETPQGIDILVHVGVDTVQLNGEGFKALIKENTQVKKGQPLLSIDLEKVKSQNKPIITPVLISNTNDVTIEKRHMGQVVAGETVVMTVKRK